MLPRNRRPTLPGEILRYEFLEPLRLTQKELAAALGITANPVSRTAPSIGFDITGAACQARLILVMMLGAWGSSSCSLPTPS